jgi:hypothetical protein
LAGQSVQSRGTRHFSDEVVLEELGALRFGMTNGNSRS